MEKWWNREEGTSMVEYILMLALVALVAVGAVRVLGTTVAAKFAKVTTELTRP